MALPFLPGYSFDRNVGKDKYHKSHHFDAKNNVTFMFGDDKPGIGGDPLPGQRHEAARSFYPGGEASRQPAWVAFDKQVLCFDAFYQEGVSERREEQYRIRNCKIYFYLEDDSVQVVEPRMKNSGLPQGTLIRRHRISRPPPYDESYYTVHDFNVGVELNIYGRVFRLVGCDEFTHNFLRKMGVKVGLPEKVPNDPYSDARKGIDESMQPLRPYDKQDHLRQFLDHDRHVLRFYCLWDDSESLYGDAREMVLHYFLSDDTVEIRETIHPNSGRDAASCFLRRQKLPKQVDSVPLPGVIADRTVLNVIGPITSGRYILDNLKTGSQNVDYYCDKDFTIGTYINVYGRKFLICDCDDFTKEYYRTKYGVNEFRALTHTGLPGSQQLDKDTLPPYNGWGNEEDSAGNCRSMLPKPPKRDFIKFMEKDRKGHESYVLRFLARMVTEHPINKERRFVISYFLADDTMLIHEPPIRNSGVIGGKFLERGRMKKPGQERYATENPEYYQASDLYVGAIVDLNSYKFELIDADEYAYRFMESNPCEFPYADIERILHKVRQCAGCHIDKIKAFFAEQDPNNTGLVSFDEFLSLLTQIMGERLVRQEMLVLARFYAERASRDLDVQQMLAVAQQQLRKHNFHDFSKLTEMCLHQDRNGSGILHPQQLRNIFRCFQMPLPDDLTRAVLRNFTEADNISTDYKKVLCSLNWREHPIVGVAEFTGSLDKAWSGTETKYEVDTIRYEPLVNDILGAKPL